MPACDPDQPGGALRPGERSSSALQYTAQAVGQAPQRLRESFIGELMLAVACVAVYVKAGTSWEGLAALAAKYHWAGSEAFRALFAPGLAAHAWEIALFVPAG